MKLYTITLVVLFYFCKLMIAQQPGGAVLISDNGETLNPSAILQVSSDKKGVLFPRMSFEAATNIENKKDGLIVFITDSVKLGYWYWKATEAKWMQIRDEETGSQDIEAPLGAIIMYSGAVNTTLFDNTGKGKCDSKMEGWQICNGQNGSPDLSGRFIMGAVTSGTYKKYGGNDSIKLTEGNLPVHKHSTNTINGRVLPHDHTITDNVHYHSFTQVWKKIGVFNRSSNYEVRNDGDVHVTMLDQTDDLGENKIELKPAKDIITYTASQLNEKEFVKKAGGGKAIDNRPSFYVLLYLVRVNTSCP